MLEIINLTKKYQTKAGELIALDHLNLTLPNNGLIFVTGKSGSGKTTLLNLVGALDDYDEGDVIIDGQAFSSFSTADFGGYRNTIIGFIFQEYNLIPDYTVEKNIKIATELQGEESTQERIDELLELVDLKGLNNRKPNELSGGQKQRVAIARALIKNPKIIMADEPTGALDQATGIAVMQTLKKLSKEKLVLVVSHDMEIAESFADRIIRLVDGKLSSDTTFIDEKATSSITVSGSTAYVKRGAKLNDKEIALLGNAVEEQKKIVYVDDKTFRAKVPTDSILKQKQDKVNNKLVAYQEDFTDLEHQIKQKEKKTKLVQSKMKTSSSISLGVRSLKVKPFRLFFTIFFSVLAFTLFGMFDSLAQFDKMKSLKLLLEDNSYPAITASGAYSTQEVDSSARVGQSVIDQVNAKTGYNFRPLYEIYDNNPLGMGELNTIKEPRTNSDLPVGKYYYQPYLNDFIEFKNEEIGDGAEPRQSEKNKPNPSKKGTQGAIIDEKGFNLKILYGEYPDSPKTHPLKNEHNNPVYDENGQSVYGYVEKSFYDVAISKYTAESIVYWMKANSITRYKYEDEDGKNNDGAGRRIEKPEDLIGVPIKLSSNQRFFIRGIVDTGEIPEKYDSLKDIAPTSQINNLAEDLSTYLRSSLNFKLFVPEGYVNTYREYTNRATKYFASGSDYTLNGKGLIGNTSTHYSFYNTNEYISDANQDNPNVILFNGVVPATLRKNDVIINVKDFANFYWQELESYGNNSPSAINTLNSFAYLSKDEYYNKAIYPLENKLGSNIVKNTTLTRQVKNGSTVEKFSCRIVGVYFGLDTDISLPLNELDRSSHAPYPVMISSSFMTDIGVYNSQGEFARMVSPTGNSANNPEALSQAFCSTEGVKVTWYGNGQLTNLENNKQALDSITNVLFYLSLVLACFSAYMIFNYISVSINSRKQSVGVLRALGSKSYDIATIFITEGVVISVVSGLIASVTAFLGCLLINLYVKVTMGFVMQFAFYTIRQILIILGITFGTGILACAIPIAKICKKKPVDLIRKP